MNAGTGYMVLAAGDEDILDLDVVATMATGRTLAEDDDSTALGVLSFTPSETGRVTIELKNYLSLRPGFCALVILREVPQARLELEELAKAMRNTVVGARLASLRATWPVPARAPGSSSPACSSSRGGAKPKTCAVRPDRLPPPPSPGWLRIGALIP